MDTVQAVRTLFGPNRDPSIGKTPPLSGAPEGGGGCFNWSHTSPQYKNKEEETRLPHRVIGSAPATPASQNGPLQREESLREREWGGEWEWEL